MTQSHSLSYTIKFYIPLLDICLLLQSQLGHECHYNRSYITNTRSAESKTGGIQNYLFIYLLNQLILSSLLFHILPSILLGGGGCAGSSMLHGLFSSCSEQGLLAVVAFLVVEHGL